MHPRKEFRDFFFNFSAGTVYKIGEPIFLPSIANSFVFRCADGMLIDGNDRGLSRLIYKYCKNKNTISIHQNV